MTDSRKVVRVIVLAITIGLTAAAVCAQQTTGQAAHAPLPTLLAQAQGDHGNASQAGEAGPKGSCDVPREYVRLINAGQYDALGALFSDDAVYMGPDGKTRHGSKAIGDFYKKFLSVYKPEVRAASYMQQGNDCMMELESKSKNSGKYILTAVDHFTVTDGKASRFVVYLRPGPRTLAETNAALAKMR